MKLSIVIPVYNEQNTLEKIIKKVLSVKLPLGVLKEIIIVNDGSTDDTLKILKKIKSKSIKIFHHTTNQGKGAAIRTGFSKVSGDFVIIQDADLEYDPQDFNRLLSPILNKRARVIYGTRLKNYPLKLFGKDKTPMPSHWFGNKFLTLFTNILYRSNLTDMETCYKLFTKDVIKNLQLTSQRFEIEPEITAKLLKSKIKILEIPIKVNPRTKAQGKKITWKDGFIAVYTLLKHRL